MNLVWRLGHYLLIRPDKSEIAGAPYGRTDKAGRINRCFTIDEQSSMQLKKSALSTPHAVEQGLE